MHTENMHEKHSELLGASCVEFPRAFFSQEGLDESAAEFQELGCNWGDSLYSPVPPAKGIKLPCACG